MFTSTVDAARLYSPPSNGEVSEAARPPSIGQFPTTPPSRRTTFGDTWARGGRVATRPPTKVLPNQRVMPDRDNGGVALSAVVRNRERKFPTQRIAVRAWEAPSFTAGRMSQAHQMVYLRYGVDFLRHQLLALALTDQVESG